MIDLLTHAAGYRLHGHALIIALVCAVTLYGLRANRPNCSNRRARRRREDLARARTVQLVLGLLHLAPGLLCRRPGPPRARAARH